MSDTNDTKQVQEVKTETVKSEQKNETVSSDMSFSNNLIIESQKKMVLEIESLRKSLAESKRNEEKTLNLLRERDAADKARIQGDLVNKALGEYQILPNAKEVAVNMIKGKLSFDDSHQPLWEGKQVDESALKGSLEGFFKDNSFLLDKSVKTQTVINNTVKPQAGITEQKTFDMKTPEGISAYLKARMGVKR